MLNYTARKKPSQSRSQETLDAVFEAAIIELRRSDERKFSVNRVAETAGVSIGSLYQYFPNKEALLSAAITRFAARCNRSLADTIQNIQETEKSTGTPLPLETIMDRIISVTIQGKRNGISLETRMIAWFTRVGSIEQLTELDQTLIQTMAIGLRSLLNPPARIRPVDPDLAARVLMQSIRGVLVTSLWQAPELYQDESLRRELTQLAVRYLQPEADSAPVRRDDQA